MAKQNQSRTNDAAQIAFITNNKTLVSACDSLELADIDKDKSPAGIHAKYSRIKLCVTDFSKTPSVYLTFYLKPTEIRRIYWQSKVVKGQKEFAFPVWSKKKERGGKTLAEMLVISHEPWRDKEKKEASKYPWRIAVSSGEYPKNSQKPSFNKSAFKLLSDDEMEDFFCAIVTYLSAWETMPTG